MTPYDVLINKCKAKERESGWEKIQVSGFPPDSFYEDWQKQESKKELDLMNENISKLNARNQVDQLTKNITSMLFREAGQPQPDYEEHEPIREGFYEEIGLGMKLSLDEEGKEGDIKEPDTQAYYRGLSQAEVDQIKFLYVPPWVFNRIAAITEELVGDGFFSGSRGDSDRMIHIINHYLDACGKVLMKQNPAEAAHGFFELFAITSAALEVSWWYECYNHLDGAEEVVGIASKLSKLWKRALSPEICTSTGISAENRDAFKALLHLYNTREWKISKLEAMDAIYTPADAANIQICWE